MSVARILARGWYQGNKTWWRLSSAVLAIALVALLISGGLFAGMQQETEDRVSDFFVHEYRLSHGRGVIPPDVFGPEVMDAYDGTVRFESQLVISRRGFVEQAVNEDEGFGIQTPGGTDKDLALGVLLGVTGPDRIASHLVAGRMPTYQNGSMELLMSESRFYQFLTQSEANQLRNPPTQHDLNRFTFSVTAARLEGGSLSEGGDLIRDIARVVGLYQTGVDVLDDFTYVAAIEDVRTLQGFAPDEPVANVMLLGNKPESDGQLHGQTASTFNQRYLGQMLGAMQLVSTTSAIVLFVLPMFLVANGVLRQLQTQNREIAVTHAIGVSSRSIQASIALLLLRMSGQAVAATALVVAIAGIILHVTLPGLQGAPVPLDFHVTWLNVLAALLVLVGSVAVGALVALAQSRQLNPATELRV